MVNYLLNTQPSPDRPVNLENQMKNSFIESTTAQTNLIIRMRSQTCGHSGALNFSPTTGTMKITQIMKRTLSWDLEEMVALLIWLVDKRIARSWPNRS